MENLHKNKQQEKEMEAKKVLKTTKYLLFPK
jgi:hypothetical protein